MNFVRSQSLLIKDEMVSLQAHNHGTPLNEDQYVRKLIGFARLNAQFSAQDREIITIPMYYSPGFIFVQVTED